MRIDLKEMIHVPGEEKTFDYVLSLPELELNQQKPVSEPVRISGSVRNVAGMLILSGSIRTTLHWTCDRCAAEFQEERELPVEAVLAESVEDEENDEIVLLEDGQLDLDDVFVTALVLETPMKILCREDCRGLCPKCGKNLNEGECTCPKKEVDPRLAALAKLLEQ